MTQLKTRFRIHFTKQGDLRWISHLDLARVWERLLRRTGIELVFSQGFHPKPKISFPSALALGIESLDEVVEMEVIDDGSQVGELGKRIAAQMPAGMKLLAIHLADAKANLLGNSFRMNIPEGLRESTQHKIDALMAAGFIRIVRDEKAIECSINHPYFSLRVEGEQLTFTLPAGNQIAAIRPIELLQQLALDSQIQEGTVLQKTETHLADAQSQTAMKDPEECLLSE